MYLPVALVSQPGEFSVSSVRDRAISFSVQASDLVMSSN